MSDRTIELERRNAAPVAMFVHSRVTHTRRTLEALAANTLAGKTALYIFADAARHIGEIEAVEAVRRLAAETTGFKSVEVIERTTNLGLARNIVEGVTSVVQRHGRVIVMEDDLVTGPWFLAFLNDALSRYEADKRVWHVNGWTYPVDLKVQGLPFFTSVMECWGWATWADRWVHFRKDPADLLQSFTRADVDKFNIDGGYDYWSDVKRNATGTMNTWAVFWYATIFKAHGLCLSPPQSHVVNIGIDGSGTNSGSGDLYAATIVAQDYTEGWPDEVIENENAWRTISTFLHDSRPSFWRRLASKLKWTLKEYRKRF